jgi:hypothetical protein
MTVVLLQNRSLKICLQGYNKASGSGFVLRSRCTLKFPDYRRCTPKSFRLLKMYAEVLQTTEDVRRSSSDYWRCTPKFFRLLKMYAEVLQTTEDVRRSSSDYWRCTPKFFRPLKMYAEVLQTTEDVRRNSSDHWRCTPKFFRPLKMYAEVLQATAILALIGMRLPKEYKDNFDVSSEYPSSGS